LIDIKHMSLKSRKDYYEYRRSKGYSEPILATHMGVTGLSWDYKFPVSACKKFKGRGYSMIKYYQEKQEGALVPFNPCSINMYDEDIKEVLLSGGLIGMSLDRGILGG
ncbi:MAG: hypothetical protein H0X62_10060, partial [Bacteroidetes bacterium]|nr:hypothetical protein [Bacteroidota bacterium]